ncbi:MULTISPECIES: hypothetical protein [Flavobacteriaceae]|uniref:hypothetical protein n=1 Tax=Flavobacteriaceae TaxID=49546 RepID=UPI00234B97C4|nr:hypothetical protein [Muricauda sp. SP22]MDC6361647.1 hypothetical protein [Muricauda sp. SP22]
MREQWEGLKEMLNSPATFIMSITWTLLFSLLTYFLGVFTGWYRKNIFLFRYTLRRIWNIIPHKKYVILWNDDNESVSENIKTLLGSRAPGFKYRIISEPDKLLGFPLAPKHVHIIFLIVSDVTKLAEVEKVRELIQKRLIDYVRKGGNLFGTHDIIYKRCRNTSLQKAYGCEISNFKRFSRPIKVKIDDENKNHPLLEGIPEEFAIDDGELCWGQWGNGAKTLIRTVAQHKNNSDDKRINVPTLVIRHTGEIGTFIWFNSADKYNDIARSINEPQEEVIRIFENAIKNSDRIKKFDNPI